MESGAFKWWHGVLIAAAITSLLWGGWSAFGRGGGQPRLVGELLFADVATGELFRFDVSGRAGVVVPERNPDTGRNTLLGVERAEDGTWRIRERHLPQLTKLAPLAAAVVNIETGEIRVADARPRKGR